MALLRVLSPVTPDDGQVQHAATLGHEQGQQPIGKVVEVGGFLEHGFHGRSAHHDQAVNVAGAVADNALVYATATAGNVDDAVTSGSQVDGAVFRTSAAGAGTAVVFLDRPSMNGQG